MAKGFPEVQAASQQASSKARVPAPAIREGSQAHRALEENSAALVQTGHRVSALTVLEARADQMASRVPAIEALVLEAGVLVLAVRKDLVQADRVAPEVRVLARAGRAALVRVVPEAQGLEARSSSVT